MKRRGFTLVELLVVISIIALLMAVLMPALGRARAMAYRVVCGSHLSGIGKSMLIYSNDNEEEYPCAGGRRSIWGTTGTLGDMWDTPLLKDAFGVTPVRPGEATITSSFWLLVKYADVTPKQFICKGDAGTKIFKLTDEGAGGLDYADVWDFGTTPGMKCSYSYHMPYYDSTTGDQGYPVTAVSRVESALCADRNPYLDKNVDYLGNAVDSQGDPLPRWGEEVGEDYYYDEPPYSGGAAAHQREGQNVLFNDSHVKFERFPNVGVENDNIYQAWPQSYQRGDPYPDPVTRQLSGATPSDSTDVGTTAPKSPRDAYLVNESNIY